MVRIFCSNTRQSKEFPEGTSLLQMLPDFALDAPYPIVSAKVNNVSQGLKFRAFQNRDVEFLDVRDPSGMRVYCRSLCFLLFKAAQNVFPGGKLYMEHPISHGYFCHLRHKDGSDPSDEDLVRLKAEMRALVERDIPFHRFDVRTEEAIAAFREAGYTDKVRLLESSGEAYTDYYMLDGAVDYYYGKLVPSTGFLQVWDVIRYYDGILLQVPSRTQPDRLADFVLQPKTFAMFKETLRWNLIMGLSTVADVNEAFMGGRASELIQIAEALQEKRIVRIAEEIERLVTQERPVRLILITGPSSSGKTTFCKRLSIQLKACGLTPVSLSTDDYFVNRKDTPKFPDGRYDFDNYDTVDHALMQQDIQRILEGECVSVPEYNFVTGLREYNGRTIQLQGRGVLLVEGIHALNPALTASIPDGEKFRVFINTLTSTLLDDHNWIPPTDNRLLRRIVRDYNQRGYSALESISNWPHVLDAERKWIYPHQEVADVMFDSAYLLEFAVLKNHAEPLLRSVPQNCPEYAEAHRLLKFIHYFTPVSDREIPATSLIREFLGGSSF